jgi:hypothetical protein
MDKDSELEYLMNPALYDKYLELSSKERNEDFVKEKKFYKKRIFQVAKDMIKSKPPKEYPIQIQNCFNQFVLECIQHFRCIDEVDELQTEYNDLLDEEGNIILDSMNVKELDTALLTQREKKIVTLDNFVHKTNHKIENPIPLPKQKEVNIDSDKYRTKGVKKK